MSSTKPMAGSDAPAVGSYNDILKSTSIIGGSQVINYLIGMVRTKLVAMLLGPDGVGLVGLFQSSIALVTQLTGMGIASSGVRQIAEAHGTGDTVFAGKTVQVLRRTCWATGILGWLVTAVLARPLSHWAFDSSQYAGLVAILGITLLFTALAGGESALIQGTRRIGDLARMTVISSLAATIVAVSLYWLFGQNGIVPVLIATAVVNLGVSWWFSRRIEMPVSAKLTWADIYKEAKKLTNLGFAFMWGGLAAALLDLGIRSMIVRYVDLEATGIYQAAWGLSGMFASFILAAMGTDFYPRITAVANNHSQLNSMVNEQIEIGTLIALPGLMATLALAPMLMTIFYSQEFVIGGELLPWFVLGIFLRVVSWPVGFSLLAKGASRWFIVTQTHFCVVNYLLAWWLIKRIGLIGAGMAFFLTFLPVVLLNLFVANRLSGFHWSASAIRVIALSALLVLIGFASSILQPLATNLVLGLSLSFLSGILCLRGIVHRVGQKHRPIQVLMKIPGMRFVVPQ